MDLSLSIRYPLVLFKTAILISLGSCAPSPELLELPSQETLVKPGSLPRTIIIPLNESMLNYRLVSEDSDTGSGADAVPARRETWRTDDGVSWNLAAVNPLKEFDPEVESSRVFLGQNRVVIVENLFSFDTQVELPTRNRFFESRDGIEWRQVNEAFSISPLAFPNPPVVGESGTIFHSYRAQGRTARFPNRRQPAPGEYLYSRDGRSWEVGVMPGLAETDADGFAVATIDDRALHMGYERRDGLYLQHLWMLDVKERTFTPLAVQTEVPPDVPAESVSRRLPNPITGREDGALVVHDGAWYLIGGETRSSLNEFDYFVHSADNNDVWRSSDGSTWELISRPREINGELDYAFDTFPERSGAQVVSWRGVLYLTGGEGLGWIPAIGEPGDPDYIPAGPGYHYGRDAWVSRDGIEWHLLAREEGAYERARAEYMEGERAFYFKRRREFEASQ